MRILVTGASGFVGRFFCDLAEGHAHQVRRVVRRAPEANREGVFEGDLSTTRDWSAAMEGVDVVVHLAARVHQLHETPDLAAQSYQRVNIDATRLLVQQAAQAGVKRFVFISSIKVNGERSLNRPFTEDCKPAPDDLYGRSKWLAESQVREYAVQLGMEWTIIRPPLVYGGGAGGNLVRLLSLIKRGIPLPLGKVSSRRSYVSVWNLADLILLCCEHPAAANQLFLAEDLTLRTPDFIKQLGHAMGRRVRLLPVPRRLLAIGTCLPRIGAGLSRLTGELEVSAAKARRVLGWQPPVAPDEGIRRMVVQYLRQFES